MPTPSTVIAAARKRWWNAGGFVLQQPTIDFDCRTGVTTPRHDYILGVWPKGVAEDGTYLPQKFKAPTLSALLAAVEKGE